MDKQIGQESSVIALEERVRVLENRVTALSDVIRILAHGLEDLPTAEPGQRPAAEAARRAYELLLVAEPRARDAGRNSGRGGRFAAGVGLQRQLIWRDTSAGCWCRDGEGVAFDGAC